jgi:hypothetical protein
MMHFLFNLLRIKGLYMFRALLAHPQVALHKQHLLYCVLHHQLKPSSSPIASTCCGAQVQGQPNMQLPTAPISAQHKELPQKQKIKNKGVNEILLKYDFPPAYVHCF